MQLQYLGVESLDKPLREQLVQYLQSNPYSYVHSHHLKEFISAPVVSDNLDNADTEAPDDEDEYISSIEDP